MNFLCFQTVLGIMLDSVTTIQVEPHQCPTHQSILHIQGPIPEIFTKNSENWQSPENDFCFSFQFLVIGTFKNFVFCFFSMKNTKEVHMRQCLFLYYGWFLQNLEKGFIRTNMHTTVHVTNLCKFSDVTIIRISLKNLPRFKMKISMTCFQLISNEQCLIINMGIPGKLFDKVEKI